MVPTALGVHAQRSIPGPPPTGDTPACTAGRKLRMTARWCRLWSDAVVQLGEGRVELLGAGPARLIGLIQLIGGRRLIPFAKQPVRFVREEHRPQGGGR